MQESIKMAGDSRIRSYVYDPNEVFIYTGHYRYASQIEFSPDEKIQQISVGDSTSWMITQSGSRIFLKPIEQDATTNMSVITDKRIYLFELHAEEAADIRAEEMVFVTRFVYPESSGVDSSFRQFAYQERPDVEQDPGRYNFNYTITGSQLIAPLKVFDDGEFTFLKFRGTNADVPAIFLVDDRGNESLVNYRVSGEYIVIERVSKQFTLRHGDDVACLFNEANRIVKTEEKRKKFLGLF